LGGVARGSTSEGSSASLETVLSRAFWVGEGVEVEGQVASSSA